MPITSMALKKFQYLSEFYKMPMRYRYIKTINKCVIFPKSCAIYLVILNYSCVHLFRYAIMQQCWQSDPNDRPDFDMMGAMLERIMEKNAVRFFFFKNLKTTPRVCLENDFNLLKVHCFFKI